MNHPRKRQKSPREQPSGSVRRSARLQKLEIHHKVGPIQSSSSSSSTPTRSSQLRMPKHQTRHIWTNDEELMLFKIAIDVLGSEMRFAKKNQFNKEIAKQLNVSFPRAPVRFTEEVVKEKLSLFRKKWASQANIAPEDRELYTSEGKRITGNAKMFERLLTGEVTDSGAESLGGSGTVKSSSSSKKKKVEVTDSGDELLGGSGTVGSSLSKKKKKTQASDIEAYSIAVKELAAHGVVDMNYTICTEILRDPKCLIAYFELETMEAKVNHLLRTWQLRNDPNCPLPTLPA